MPSSLPDAQPAAREPPKSPNTVLAEAEAQWIFTEDELARTPSILDGMPVEKERELRSKGINFIMQVGIMLKLPNITLGTAYIFFNRFLMRHSLVDKPGVKALHHYQLAATALFLATKVEENCRKMKEIVVACCRVAQKKPNLLIDEQSKDYWRWRDTILFSEDVLLEAICFDLTIEAPHKTLFEMLKYYHVESNKPLRNNAWAFLNDSSLTMLCLLFTSRTIAASALYAAAKGTGVSLPDDEQARPWWEVQHVRLRDIRRACNYMAATYEDTPLKPEIESLYVGLRQPENDDDGGETDTTRMRFDGSQVPNTPTGGSIRGVDEDREERGVKRSRENTAETSTVDSATVVAVGNASDNGNGHTAQELNGREAPMVGSRPTMEPGLPPERAPLEGQEEERESKRMRQDVNGTYAAHAQPMANGTAGGEDDNASEEGELDE